MKIEAAVVREQGGQFNIESVDLDVPRHDEILVRNIAVGICHTDLVVRDQGIAMPLPVVLGHEGSGIVEQVGASVTKVKPGDKVVMTYHSCGHCLSCYDGAPAYCSHLLPNNFSGRRLDGSATIHQDGIPFSANFFQQSSFATHSLATERNVVKVDSALADDTLALFGPLGCGIQTGAGAVLNSLRAKAGSSLAVFGVGSVGLSAIMAARLAGCAMIIAIDLNEERLELARSLGATHTVNARSVDAVDFVRTLSGGGVDYSLEMTASPKVLRQAVECLHTRGICGLIGLPPAGTDVALDMGSILFGRTLKGIIEGDSVPEIFISQMINLHLQGRFPIDRIMRHYRFDQINAAVHDSETGQAIKAVLRIH